MAAILDFLSERFYQFLIYQSPLCVLPSFESVGLSIQEKKRKIDFKEEMATMAAILYFQGWETSGLILISGLRTFILSMKFHFYTYSQDHPFVPEVVI